MAQTCTDYEWIIIDGASDDGTPDWIHQNAPHALITSEPDDGLYDAMNKGLARASGDYVLFLNGGDQLADAHVLDNLNTLITMASTPPGFIYGDALETLPDGKTTYKPARPYTKAALGMFTHHQAMVYARAVIGDLQYDTDYKIAADYKFTLQILARTNGIYYVPEPLCIFAPGGVSQMRTTLGRHEQFYIRRDLGVVGPVKNRMITIAQWANMMIRTYLPRLYWAMKKRR